MIENTNFANPDAAANFRDVGEWINEIARTDIWPVGQVYRGGAITPTVEISAIGSPKTIFCLLANQDPPIPGVNAVHFLIANMYEKYDTSLPEVRRWLTSIVRTIETGIDFPLYVHCRAGRDRTGIVIAALLRICGVDEEHIIAEYSLSTGTDNLNGIQMALDGLRGLDRYFGRADLAKVKSILLSQPPLAP